MCEKCNRGGGWWVGLCPPKCDCERDSVMEQEVRKWGGDILCGFACHWKDERARLMLIPQLLLLLLLLPDAHLEPPRPWGRATHPCHTRMPALKMKNCCGLRGGRNFLTLDFHADCNPRVFSPPPPRPPRSWTMDQIRCLKGWGAWQLKAESRGCCTLIQPAPGTLHFRPDGGQPLWTCEMNAGPNELSGWLAALARATMRCGYGGDCTRSDGRN